MSGNGRSKDKSFEGGLTNLSEQKNGEKNAPSRPPDATPSAISKRFDIQDPAVLDRLREGFNFVDRDKSGTIDMQELGLLLELESGHSFTEDELQLCINKMDVDDSGQINFEEFVAAVDGLGAIDFESSAEMVRALANEADNEWRHGIWIGMESTLAGENGENLEGECCKKQRLWVIETLDGTKAQMVILFLVIVDIFAIYGELLIAATACGHDYDLDSIGAGEAEETTIHVYHQSCDCSAGGQGDGAANGTMAAILHRRRRLGGGAGFSPRQYEVEHTLHIISVSILAIFAAQILGLIFAFGKQYFKSPVYVADFVIISVSLVCENMKLTEASLIVCLMCWRAIRIVHAFYLSQEIQHKRTHQKIHQMEHKVKEDIRAKSVVDKFKDSSRQKSNRNTQGPATVVPMTNEQEADAGSN